MLTSRRAKKLALQPESALANDGVFGGNNGALGGIAKLELEVYMGLLYLKLSFIAGFCGPPTHQVFTLTRALPPILFFSVAVF